jgi:hypothetical protein
MEDNSNIDEYWVDTDENWTDEEWDAYFDFYQGMNEEIDAVLNDEQEVNAL